MAIEDAIVLARCLDLCGDDNVSAFARYEAARIERTTRAVLGAAENAKRFHSRTLGRGQRGGGLYFLRVAGGAGHQALRLAVRL